MVDKKLDLFWVLISSCLSCLLPVLGDERSQERFELELQVEGFEEQVEKEIKSNKWDDSLVLPFEKDCLRKLDELLLVTTSYLQSLEPPMPDMKKKLEK
jgi:hypothetical protein